MPNILTISRIVVIPVIFLSIYIHTYVWSLFAAVLFIIASITDYFDGYLARSRNETSAFGRLFDPIADKLLVVSALLIIVANGLVDKISYVPVVIILCREVLVSGLREFLAEVKIGLPVTRLAKWKTGFQMTALSMILGSGCGVAIGEHERGRTFEQVVHGRQFRLGKGQVHERILVYLHAGTGSAHVAAQLLDFLYGKTTIVHNPNSLGCSQFVLDLNERFLVLYVWHIHLLLFLLRVPPLFCFGPNAKKKRPLRQKHRGRKAFCL